jgi:queuine/archaeosine tRNA-ribosyltransferase
MTDLILNPARAQYAPALQENFIRGMAAFPAGTLPAGLTSADLNILRRASPVFTPYALVSYGMFIEREGAAAPGIIATRDKPATTIIGDSGGFQFISKPELYQGRATVLKALGWLQANADISMTVDIPTRAIGRSRWPTFQACLDDTLVNLAIIAAERTAGRTKFLNVLQGTNWAECRAWYDAVKAFPFEGWAFGGASRDLPNMLRLISMMRRDRHLGGQYGHLHVLGTSSLRRAVELTAIKRAIQKAGLDVQLTFDTATPSHYVKYGKVIVGMNETALTATPMKFPLEAVHAACTLALPGRTWVAERFVVRDLHVNRTAGSLLLVHHNIEQQLRLMEEAGRVADIAHEQGAGLPVAIHASLHAIEGFLSWKNPADAAKRLTGVALEPLDDETAGERS